MRVFFTSSLLILLLSLPCFAETLDSDPDRLFQTFSIYFENDLFYNTDYLYTNGVKLAWSGSNLEAKRDKYRLGRWMSAVGDRLPFFGLSDRSNTFSLAIGQNIYTPEDTKSSELLKDDRPYAGLSYLELGISANDNHWMTSWEITVGLVGPHSYAKETQQTVHEWKKLDVPAGWDHQLKDEPVVSLMLTQWIKLLKYPVYNQLSYDLVSNWGAGIGNLYTGVQVGTQMRIGWNLPNDFGTTLIRPGALGNTLNNNGKDNQLKEKKNFSVYLFGGLDGYAVLRNITLDGNTFEDSHSVDKEPLVAAFIFGINMTFSRCQISYTHAYQTKTFKDQKDNAEFGSIAFKYFF